MLRTYKLYKIANKCIKDSQILGIKESNTVNTFFFSNITIFLTRNDLLFIRDVADVRNPLMNVEVIYAQLAKTQLDVAFGK